MMNAAECAIQGPSRYLPGGYLLTSLSIPRGCTAYGSVTDRKDFYHQCWVSEERAATNVTPFRLSYDELKDFPALDVHLRRIRKKRGSRTEEGDRLGMAPRSILCGSEPLYPCFKAIFQGDHLGVEFALLGHASLLETCGLLRPEGRLLGGAPFPMSSTIEGLVIDDYFSISVAPVGLGPRDSESFKNLEKADA